AGEIGDRLGGARQDRLGYGDEEGECARSGQRSGAEALELAGAGEAALDFDDIGEGLVEVAHREASSLCCKPEWRVDMGGFMAVIVVSRSGRSGASWCCCAWPCPRGVGSSKRGWGGWRGAAWEGRGRRAGCRPGGRAHRRGSAPAYDG